MPSSPDTTASGGFVRRYGAALAAIGVITALHYLTPHGGVHDHSTHTTSYPWYVNMHGIYRRLYYLPIIFAAFRGGLRGGLGSAVLVVTLYVPHALGLIGHDPGTGIEKFLEILLYLGVGLLSGGLVERLNLARRHLQQTAEDLQAALDDKTAMEAELVRTEKLAAVGRLSAGLAHEIRNPLASIRGSAEVLGDDFPADHPKGGLFRILLEETGRLNGVLTRFLDFARSEPGESRPFDLAAEAEAVRQLLAHQPDTAPVRIRGTGPVPALGNRESIRQVLLNLAMNGAAAAGPDGEVTLELDCTAGVASCRVTDTGPGFSDEAAANFGTPFYSSRHGGTGLGLATSLRIAEGLGGSLQLDREHAGGSVVLTLPCANA